MYNIQEYKIRTT